MGEDKRAANLERVFFLWQRPWHSKWTNVGQRSLGSLELRRD